MESTDDLDGNDVLLPEWAARRSNGNYMEVGAQLATRDGRKMGNAYVDGIESHLRLGEVAVVVTDMGNTFRMTSAELEEAFHSPAYVMRVDEARKRRGIVVPGTAVGNTGASSLSALVESLQTTIREKGDTEHVALSFVVDGQPAQRLDVFGPISVLHDTAIYPNGMAYLVADCNVSPGRLQEAVSLVT